MKMCVMQCYLALLGFALVLCSSGASTQPDLERNLELDQGLRQRKLLQRARVLGMAAQDWSKRELEDLLSRLTLPESKIRESEMSTLGAQQDLKVELERSAENSINNAPREQKPGCTDFYWKGFLSC
ncbi:somatostatin-2 [Electrophorus electricus]|uniref:Somatostatin-2 n=2 Tax=Electrophorus TaxID=8004 RepID=A0A4W4G3F9_ELEEL|nr:somatostatin-2 [Electrophorus electricus]